MPSKFKNLVITHADESDGYATTTDITSDLMGIPIFTDTGSGEVNEAEIALSAKGGKFINTGTIIEKFDRFRIQMDDLDGNSYDRWYELTGVAP